MKLLQISIFALLFSFPAFGNGEEKIPLGSLFSDLKSNAPVCYGREYSSKHLERNTKQTVKKIRVKMVKDLDVPESPTEYLDVEFSLTGDENSDRIYNTVLLCDSSAGECYVECDGGRIKAWGTKEGDFVFENLGILIAGGCGDDENSLMLKPSPGGDSLFQLTKLPQQFCQL